MIKKFLPFSTAFLANAFTIHLQQAGGLEEDWGSFLRNIAFFKVLAQKDRNHCWIYSPSHCCLWVRCKSCALINLLLRPFFFHLHFDLITFVSLRFIFFHLFFFPLVTGKLVRLLNTHSVLTQKNSLGVSAWPSSPNIIASFFSHLTPLPQISHLVEDSSFWSYLRTIMLVGEYLLIRNQLLFRISTWNGIFLLF